MRVDWFYNTVNVFCFWNKDEERSINGHSITAFLKLSVCALVLFCLINYQFTTALLTMLLSFATYTWSAHFINARHNNLANSHVTELLLSRSYRIRERIKIQVWKRCRITLGMTTRNYFLSFNLLELNF